MTFTEAVKGGFNTINRNWQLVLIQIGAMFASLIGFFIFVGIPLAIAFIIFGLDLTELARFDDILGRLREPTKIISKYFWLIVMVLASFLVYLIAVFTFGIFVFGGSIGVIGRSVRDIAARFNLKTFLSEGKRLFFPLVWFSTIIGLIFIVMAFVLGLFGGAISAIVSLAKEQEATLAVFLGIFFSSIVFVIGMVFLLALLSVTVYGSAIMAIRGHRPVVSIKEAVYYLYKHPDAFYLYCIVFVGYLIISFMLMFLGYPMKYIPLIGPLMALMYQLSVYIAQSYLGFVMIASIFSYYYATTDGLIETIADTAGLDTAPTSEDSTQGQDTYAPQAPSQEDVPPERSQNGPV